MGVAPEAVPGLVGRNERVLGNFFGIVIIDHHPVSNVVHETGVFFGDLRKFFCVHIPCWSFTGLRGKRGLVLHSAPQVPAQFNNLTRSV
jgi:hypothetical protein